MFHSWNHLSVVRLICGASISLGRGRVCARACRVCFASVWCLGAWRKFDRRALFTLINVCQLVSVSHSFGYFMFSFSRSVALSPGASTHTHAHTEIIFVVTRRRAIVLALFCVVLSKSNRSEQTTSTVEHNAIYRWEREQQKKWHKHTKMNNWNGFPFESMNGFDWCARIDFCVTGVIFDRNYRFVVVVASFVMVVVITSRTSLKNTDQHTFMYSVFLMEKCVFVLSQTMSAIVFRLGWLVCRSDYDWLCHQFSDSECAHASAFVVWLAWAGAACAKVNVQIVVGFLEYGARRLPTCSYENYCREPSAIQNKSVYLFGLSVYYTANVMQRCLYVCYCSQVLLIVSLSLSLSLLLSLPRPHADELRGSFIFVIW